MFLDDTKVFVKVNSVKDASGGLHILQGSSEVWQLPFNPIKCKSMALSHCNNQFFYHIRSSQCGITIEETTCKKA